MGEYRDFKSEKTLLSLLRYFLFLELVKIILLGQKKIKLNFKKKEA